MNQPLFEVLGDWVGRTEFDTIPEQAREVAKRAVLDCIGVTLAGAQAPVAAVLDQYAAETESGPCTLIGRRRRSSAETAAFVNGTQGHALDFDDCTGSLGGHPSVVVLPAALAVSDLRGATGAELLTAYVVGFEVAAKLGRAMNFVHYERGWHPTATLGAFGATAATAKLMRLDARTTATALAITASMAAGMKANFGTATKPIQAGRAAQNGVLASRLAAMGADANIEAYEHPQGFGDLHNGPGHHDAERAISTLEAPWDLIEPGLTVKQYPCCASTHGAADAALSLREQVPEPTAIDSVDVWTHPRRLRHTDRPTVSTGFEAKFSVHYVVARALHSGHVGIGDFSPESVSEPAVVSLMSRVRAQPMPESRWGADHFPAEVRLTLNDGRTLHTRVERPRGNGPAEALTDTELHRKFDDCCRSVGVPAPAIAGVHDGLLSLEHVNDVGRLFAPLRGNLH